MTSGSVSKPFVSGANLRGSLMVLFASLCLSTTPPVIKLGLEAHVDPIPLLTFRLWVGTIVLWVVMGFLQPAMLRMDRRGLIGCFIAAAANSVSLSCFYIALTLIDVSIATVIFSFYPLVTILFLAFGGEQITRRISLRLVLVIAGVYFLVVPGGKIHIVGILLVITTAVFYSAQLIVIQWRLSQYPSRQVTLYIITFMALNMTFVYGFLYREMPVLSPVGWSVVLWTGIVSTAIARFALFAGIRRIGSGQTALLGPVETLLTVLWAILFLDEHLSPLQMFGAFLVIAGATLAFQRRPSAGTIPDTELPGVHESG